MKSFAPAVAIAFAAATPSFAATPQGFHAGTVSADGVTVSQDAFQPQVAHDGKDIVLSGKVFGKEDKPAKFTCAELIETKDKLGGADLKEGFKGLFASMAGTSLTKGEIHYTVDLSKGAAPADARQKFIETLGTEMADKTISSLQYGASICKQMSPGMK